MSLNLTKSFPLGLCTILTLTVGGFYYYLYPYHLHYYEQMQMFQYSADYLRETLLVPGGLADYIGRYLTQFFHIPWAGALIMALLFGGFYGTAWLATCNRLTGSNRMFWSIILLLPIRYLMIFACDENAMPATWIAFFFCLTSVWFCQKIMSRTEQVTWTKGAAIALLYLLLYITMGSLALLMGVLSCLELLRHRGAKRLWFYPLVALIAFTPLVAHHWANWSYTNLYLGIHYFRFTEIQLPHIWMAASCLVLIDLIAPWIKARHKDKKSISLWVTLGAPLLLVCLLIWHGVRGAYRPNTEVAMMYDALVLDERWDDILTEASIRTPKHPACVQCINLAMAMTGRMGDLLFRCPQPSSDALLPKFNINFSRPLTAGQVYLNLGWANTAQRFVYEANESIPDYEKSARCYQLLTETHIARGEKELARKYLKKLQQTLFYSDWANEQLQLLANPDPKAIAHHPKYGPLMNGAVRDDYFFGPDVLAMLGNYCTTTPHNRVATQYLLAMALVMRQLDTFVGCYNLSQYLDHEQRIPIYYQEALALDWWLKHGSLEGIPHSLDPRMADALQQFMTDRSQLSQAALEQRYRFSYWYFYYAGEKEETGDEVQTAAPN